MAIFASYDDIGSEQVLRHRGPGGDAPAADVYPFIGAPKDRSEGPNAFLVRYVPGTDSSAHFHAADQVQIVVEGKGRLGRHEMKPYQLHLSRAFTPYGPLIPDTKDGWAFVNLRTRSDPLGAQRLSTAREKLLAIPDRRPFQRSCDVAFASHGAAPVALSPIEGMEGEEGWRGFALTLGPGASTDAPSAQGGDGQFLIAVEGSLVEAGRTRNALTIAFVGADEAPLRLQAGRSGLKAMIVSFPAVTLEPFRQAAEHRPADRVWQCELCAFVYDEAAGMPEDGIPPGTPWESVSDAWICPDCGARKSDFVMLQV